MSSPLEITPFDGSDDHYAAWVAIANATEPDHPITADELRDRNARHDPKYAWERWLAFRGGKPVGLAEYGQSPWTFDPHRFHLDVRVVPDARRGGIGTALYDTLLASVREKYEPHSLRSSAREDRADSVSFLAHRGFTELERAWESRLDVKAFDSQPFEEARERTRAGGIRIRSVAELQRDDPDWQRKLYELESETVLDVPSEDSVTPPPFETFQKYVFENPNFLPEGFFIAQDTETGQYVGSSSVWKRQASPNLDTGYTCVRRTHRGRGIGLAMKLTVIDYARSVGCPQIGTDNHSTNRPMLSINEALGFVKQPAWITFGKEIAGGGH